MWIVYIYRKMFVIWICMMIIPLISSRFMLLEVQDEKNNNGNFAFLWILKWKDSAVSQDLLETSHWEENKYIFPSFCIEVGFLCLLAFRKLDSQSHLQLHCWSTVRADFSLNCDFSGIFSFYYRPQNKMTGLGLIILLAFPALCCIYCIFT
jgi:hypothetical protein